MSKKEKRDVLLSYKFLPIFETLVKQGKAEQAAELTIAILRYDMDGTEPEFNDDAVSLIWLSVIRPHLDENKQKYEEVSKARSEAVSSRHRQNDTNSTNATNVNKCSNSNQMNTNATDIDVDIDVDTDIDTDNDVVNKKEKNKKEKRHKYGEYQNVLLSDQDMEKLQNEFPFDWQERIEKVSEYCASHGKTYKDYLATIRNWARRDKKSPGTAQEVYNKVLGILGEDDG